MRFTDDFVEELGKPVEEHIAGRLGEVVSADRINIHKGFYSETLTRPLPIKAALVHIDCDLYQSTKEVLSWLGKHDICTDGCVLLFDDWNCFRASPISRSTLGIPRVLRTAKAILERPLLYLRV